MKKIIITLFAVGIGLSGFYFLSNTNADRQEDIASNNSKEGEQFLVSAQSGVGEVVIDQVVMGRPGFVVVRESINDRPGQIVEVSDLLTEGMHTKVIINLRGAEETKGINISGEFPLVTSFIAVVYTDNGDGGFNPLLDSVAYSGGTALARYVSTGELAPESAVVPNAVSESEGAVAANVVYTDEGFAPRSTEVSKGDTVRFTNKSSRPMWIASDTHPAHNILPTFDQFGTSAFGEGYQYTFNQVGEWKYHDHVNASEKGVVIVR